MRGSTLSRKVIGGVLLVAGIISFQSCSPSNSENISTYVFTNATNHKIEIGNHFSDIQYIDYEIAPHSSIEQKFYSEDLTLDFFSSDSVLIILDDTLEVYYNTTAYHNSLMEVENWETINESNSKIVKYTFTQSDYMNITLSCTIDNQYAAQ